MQMRRYKSPAEASRGGQLHVSPGLQHTRTHTRRIHSHSLSDLLASRPKRNRPVLSSAMAPAARPGGKSAFGAELEEDYDVRGDRKARKPLVEKKRRARINESLQELRTLLADADLQAKMENAEVLEMTVKRVENILQNRAQEADSMSREASERFAAGYIQCMHEVHTFVSACPGIDATAAAELLNHLLECMPLHEEQLTDMITDLLSEPGSSGAAWPGGEGLCAALASPGDRSVSSLSPTTSDMSPTPPDLSPTPSSASTEDLCSDLDETDSEPSIVAYNKSMWRPW